MALSDAELVPLDRDGRARLLSQAVAERDACGGQLPAPRLAEYARAAAVSTRTMQRWLARGRVPQREYDSWTPAEEDLLAYAECLGSVARVHRRMLDDPNRDGPVPSVPTLRRAFNGALSPAERAYLRQGHKGWRDHVVYAPMRVPHRNHEWQVDHKKLDVLVRIDERTKPRKPWLTTFIDAHTRVIVGWAICPSPAPSQAEIYAAMRSALRVEPHRGPFGGVPLSMRWDNGLDFLSQALSQTALALGTRIIVCESYTPEHKGKIERLHLTIKEELLAELPYFTGGPRDKAGRLYGSEQGPISIELLVELLEAWVHTYNSERTHQGLDGLTPLEAWESDIEPVRTLPDEELHWLLLKRATRKVTREGVSFPRVGWFVAPELHDLVGEHVEIRWTPGDERTLEIFWRKQHLCTAIPRDQLTQEDADEIRAARHDDKRRAARLRRTTSRRQAERFAPLTAYGQPVQHTTVITEDQARSENTTRTTRRVRKASKPSLLGDGGYAVADENDAPKKAGRPARKRGVQRRPAPQRKAG